jgi:hypothetical protein
MSFITCNLHDSFRKMIVSRLHESEMRNTVKNFPRKTRRRRNNSIQVDLKSEV